MRLLDLSAVAKVCDRGNGRRGVRALRPLLHDAQPAPLTRSELERRFLVFCREAGLPQPSVNLIVAGMEVDAVWVDGRLVVELDGYAFHRTRAAFERDRARDAALQVAGYRVVRVTAWRLADQPAAIADETRHLLG